ncbi:MAG: hypothetical protein EXR79_03865 [Myxococcales bacterium]|nr:hypothetical protein [Myxococcales bacterium]
MKRGARAVAVALAALGCVPPCCAQLLETRDLRVEVLEPARTVEVALGSGLAVRGARKGEYVQAHVERVERCAREEQQRVLGIEVVVRRAVGASLLLEWGFSGVFALAGGWLLAESFEQPDVGPPTGEIAAPRSQSLRVTGLAIGLAGLGLLGAAAVQTVSLGVHERPLGERTLRRQSPGYACRAAPAAAATVRLTLPDGTQIEALTGADGTASLPLPADVSAIVAREGRARATLEALGDAKAQIRIEL